MKSNNGKNLGAITIPPQLTELNDIRFILIDKREGHGKKPKERGWQNDRNYDANAPALLGHLRGGGNYGVRTCEGINCFDADEFELLMELGIIQRLPKTFTVKTGRTSSVGKHYWLKVEGLKKKIILYHPTLKDPDNSEERLHLGEIQSTGNYAIGPGSIHKSGNRYEVEDESPVAKMTYDELVEIIEPLMLPKKDKPVTEITLRRDDHEKSHKYDDVDIAKIAMPRGNVVKSGGRGGTEYKGTHPFHASRGGQNFSINPSKGVWHCFHHDCGGGWVELLAMKEGIISCGQKLNVDDRRKTIRRAYELGILEEEVIEAPDAEIQLDSDNVDEIPIEIPDGDVIELVAPPRTGKTHRVVQWLKQAGSGNYITHTHAVCEHAIKIAREIGMRGVVWVVGRNQPGACRHDGNCDTCILSQTKENFYKEERAVAKLLEEKKILTAADVPLDMCPYMTLKRAEKNANYCFTVVNKIGRITQRKTVILDEEPTLSHFYAGSIEIARIHSTRGDVSNKNYLAKSTDLQTELDRIINHRKKPAFKQYAVKIKEIEEIIETGSTSGEDINDVADKIYSAIKDFAPKHVEFSKSEDDGQMKGDDLSLNACVRCMGNLHKENPVRIINRGGGHRSIFLLGDERRTCYDMGWMEHAEKVIVIGATRGAIFVEEFGGRQIVVKDFRYSDRFVVLGIDASGTLRGNKSEQRKLVLKTATRLWGDTESNRRMPFLVLAGSKREQYLASKQIQGAACLNKEREGGMKAKYLSGEPAIFYQNSVISRGLDVDQYNLMFVYSCNFAEPFWSIADKGIAAAIIADETTNSVLRISPTLREDTKTMKVVVMPAEDTDKISKYITNITTITESPEKIALMLKSMNVGGIVERDECNSMRVVSKGINFEIGKKKLAEMRENADEIADMEEVKTWAEKIISFVKEKYRRTGVFIATRTIKEGVSPKNTSDNNLTLALHYIHYHGLLEVKKVGNSMKWGIKPKAKGK